MVKEIQAKSILNKHKKRDSWFLDDYSLNPYSACSFNCLYCYIRGSKYGENMAKTLSAKINAPELLENQLKRRSERGEYGIIALASATDPYLPSEEKLQLTRKLLEIILKYRFPVEIITRSKLVLRDLDLLESIDNAAILPQDLSRKLKRGVIISLSFSNMDEGLARIFEPAAPRPKEKLGTMKACKERGFLVGANLIPVLPFITDSEESIEDMLLKAKDHGADYALVGGLTLFGNGPADSKTLYYKMLEKHFPELVQKTRNLYRGFFYPPKKYQQEIDRIAKELCRKHGLQYGIVDNIV